MTIATAINRSGPYNGNGVTTVFDYEFKIEDETHVQVIRATALNVETILTLDADYTVTGVGDEGGGTIVMNSALASGLTLTFPLDVPFTQETDLENQGAYFAETVEAAFDLAAQRDLQLAERMNRAILLPASSDDQGGALAAQLAADITRLGQSADEIDTVAGIADDVETVAGIADDVALLSEVSGVLAGTASAVRMSEKVFTGDGVDTTWTLDRAPGVDENVLVWVGGAIQNIDDYSLSGVTLTISPAVANGVEIRTLVMTLLSANEIIEIRDEVVEVAAGIYVDAFATAAQGAKADAALQPSYLGFAGTGDHNAISRLPMADLDHQPVQYSGIVGSLGAGMAYRENTRTAGFGQYGDFLLSNVVTAPVVTGEFDVGMTSWVTSTNLVGGANFGMWAGANTPAKGETYSGGQSIGMEINVGNRWGDEGLKTDLANTRHTSIVQLVPDVTPTRDTVTHPVTVSAASPAVVTWAGHGLLADTPIRLFASGSIPSGITAGLLYYVDSAGLSTDTFRLKTAISGGSAVNTTTTGSGVTAIPSFPASFGALIARSVHGNRVWTGLFMDYSAIMKDGYALNISGGGSPADSPARIMKTQGYWKGGFDFSTAIFSSAIFRFDFTSQVSATATAGGLTKPAGYAGYLDVFDISGTRVKVGYYLQ